MNHLKLSVLLMITFLISSCSSDDLKIDEFQLSKSDSEKIVNLLEDNLSIELKSKITIKSFELKKINDTYYLVSKHGDLITTTLLKNKEGNKLSYAGISCTSKACANTEGCIPDTGGKKCTPCFIGLGDCSKTVTSDVFE